VCGVCGVYCVCGVYGVCGVRGVYGVCIQEYNCSVLDNS
jgi:hypothetical protein